MIYFITGLFIGFLSCIVVFIVSFLFINELIKRWGIEIKQKALDVLSNLESKTIEAKFIYPDQTKEKFESSEKIDDMLQKTNE